jgi:EAL domain-containing protein (putative c-di-GMP-specific phosphodiesterase class I)
LIGDVAEPNWFELLDRVLRAGSIHPVFQPVFSLENDAVIGYEALTRPDGFEALAKVDGLFAAAAETEQANDLDWACRRAALWGARGLDPAVLLFINVDAVSLERGDDALREMLRITVANKRDPHSVVLEITEREAVEDVTRLAVSVQGYRKLGYRFALDDVGEGHWQLDRKSNEVITAIRPEYIKLGKSLSHAAGTMEGTAAILSLADVASQIKSAVIAEGVETAAQLLALKELNLQLAQGFFLGAPAEMPAPIQRAAKLRISS